MDQVKLDKLVNDIGSPLLGTYAFRRLAQITFLGILSPRYAIRPNSPLLRKYKKMKDPSHDDGSRLDHSIQVASIALLFCDKMGLTDRTKTYAVAWGFLHDIATWPLSHTGEAAFSKLTKIKASELRKRIISGHKSLPDNYSVSNSLEKMGIDSATLLNLYDKTSNDIDAELKPLWRIIHSPLTPDTLEGIWRCGQVFGVEVPEPTEILNVLNRSLPALDFSDDTLVDNKQSGIVLTFWRRKSDIYKTYINRPSTIRWESSWSKAITECYKGINLRESLELAEHEIIANVENKVDLQQDKVIRYKPPQGYDIKPEHAKKLKNDVSVHSLHNILFKGGRKSSGL